MFTGWSSTRFVFFGADLKSNMAARVHNVFSLAEILKIFKSSHGLWPGELKRGDIY
jgi:hypothetical protein